jgi:hypothetical protein
VLVFIGPRCRCAALPQKCDFEWPSVEPSVGALKGPDSHPPQSGLVRAVQRQNSPFHGHCSYMDQLLSISTSILTLLAVSEHIGSAIFDTCTH